MQLSINVVEPLLAAALQEDIGQGDITSNAIIPENITARFAFVAREPMVISGLMILPHLFSMVDNTVLVDIRCDEGEHVKSNSVIAYVEGNARALLAAERTALNLIQRMCGIATLTHEYVQEANKTGAKAKVVDTRKTLLGHRQLDKYAVTCGGGFNHRIGLYDGVLIKDNHIAVAGSISSAIELAREANPLLTKIEVECDTIAQVKEAIAAAPDIIMLDNMTLDALRESVTLARAAHIMTEASGNVSLATIAEIALTGVDYISVGKLTHSASAVDIGLDAL